MRNVSSSRSILLDNVTWMAMDLNTNQTSVLAHFHTLVDIRNDSRRASNISTIETITLKDSPSFERISRYSDPVTIVICVILIILILATILGNMCVITAVLRERSLRGVSNYLILSLAVTDLMVALVVMPLSLINEISVHWYLGNIVCDFWISVDVLCCTASILHLVAISLDRFWGVSNIDYIRRRCARQIVIMIVIVWIASFGISIPPLFGWNDPSNAAEIQGVCKISQDLGYTLFSTIGAFYFPLVLMVLLNCKIYKAARSRIRKHKFNSKKSATQTEEEMKMMGISFSNEENVYSLCNYPPASVLEEGNSSLDERIRHLRRSDYLKLSLTPSTALDLPHKVVTLNGHPITRIPAYTDIVTVNHVVLSAKFMEHKNHKRKYKALKHKKKMKEAEKKRKDKMEMKRERKAAKVLGIITGTFIACWLPFFILAVLIPFCGHRCSVPNVVKSICLWLGYCNSSLNPILYTIFNPAFRKAFYMYKMFGNRCQSDSVLQLRGRRSHKAV